LSVVQDPVDAEAPSMPLHAIEHAGADHVVTVADIAALLGQLVTERAPPATEAPVSKAIRKIEGAELGEPTNTLVCPVCSGVLTEASAHGLAMFRCHVGHAFTLDGMALEQAEALERSLWAAQRALEESAALAHRLAERSRGALQERFTDAQRIRAMLLTHPRLTASDVVDKDIAEQPAAASRPVRARRRRA
jgi:two-component system chemotaxis response regulator CheB